MHTPEQTERWAREAGFPRSEFGFSKALINDLTRFAALVAQHERERIAQLVDPIANDIAAAIRNSDGG